MLFSTVGISQGYTLVLSKCFVDIIYEIPPAVRQLIVKRTRLSEYEESKDWQVKVRLTG